MIRRLFVVANVVALVTTFVAAGAETTDPPRVTLTIVYDNVPLDDRLVPNWGFSCLIEGMEETILFDMGANALILLENLRRLGLDLADVDAVVLSHEHQDHVGGFGALLALEHSCRIYAPKSFPPQLRSEFDREWIEPIDVSGPMPVCADATTTGELGGRIVEQALVLRLSGGLVVVTGCAHPGIVEVVEAAHALYPDDPIDLVLGGFHLLRATEAEVRTIGARLLELGVRRLAPTHCTGDRARAILAETFPHEDLDVGLGAVIELAR